MVVLHDLTTEKQNKLNLSDSKQSFAHSMADPKMKRNNVQQAPKDFC